MMKLYDRLLNSPIVFPVDQRALGDRAMPTVIYSAMHDQKQKGQMTNVWEGEGGKPVSVHDRPKGFGVFVGSHFTN
jgi:hypothetical protein